MSGDMMIQELNVGLECVKNRLDGGNDTLDHRRFLGEVLPFALHQEPLEFVMRGLGDLDLAKQRFSTM
jgi:hypothetical protein